MNPLTSVVHRSRSNLGRRSGTVARARRLALDLGFSDFQLGNSSDGQGLAGQPCGIARSLSQSVRKATWCWVSGYVTRRWNPGGL